MKIEGVRPPVDTTNVNGVTFGTVIQLTEKPVNWPAYRNWDEEKLFILTAEYYRSGVDDLLCIDLKSGSGFGLKQGTQVILRNDLAVRQES